MSSGPAWAACREGVFASVEDPQQLRLAEWMDQDKRARRCAESGARITAIAAQVASEVSAAVASEVSAAVAAALQAARAGHHGYLDLAPLTPSTPTPPVPDDLASVPDASMVFSAQQQQQEDAASPQAIDNMVTNILAAWTTTTCSTQSPTRAVTVSVSAPAAVSTLSEITVGVVTEYCCFDLEPATSTPTSALDILGACSSVINLFALPASSGVSAVVHTTCSMRCPSCIASEVSVLTSSAAPPSFMTAGSVAPEPAAPEFIPMSLRWLFPILNLENWTPTRRSTKACTLVQLEEVMNLTIASVGLPVQHSVELLNDCYIEVWVSFLSAGQLILCVFRLNQWEIAWILEWDGSEHAGVKLEELLFTNMGQKIFQANFVDIYCCGGVTAGCLSFPRLRSTDAYSTEHDMRILGRIMKLLINSVKKYTAAICVPAMNYRHADATVQEKEAYYAEYNSTLVAMLAIYQMQWKISLLLSYALISEFGTYFALKMVPKNDKLGSEFVQLEFALTVRLASVKSWFPSCFAGCDFRYGREKFQWTITWSPSSRGYVVYAPTLLAIVSSVFMGPTVEELLEGGNDVTSRSPTYVDAVVPVTTNQVKTAALRPAKLFTEHKLIGVESLYTPWAPARRTTCRMFNVQGTLYVMQLSGDLQDLETVEPTGSAALTAIIFVPGVQIAQLKPTVFKWSEFVCFDTHFLSGSTLDLLLARRVAQAVGNGSCLDNLHCALGSNNLAITHSSMHVPAPEIWVLMYCYARMSFSWKIALPKDASSGGFLAILNGRAEIQWYYSCTRILTDVVHRCQISRHILRGNTQNSEPTQRLINHSLLLSEFELHTTGNNIFFRCALVQWEFPWTIILASLKSWFQVCIAGCESLYGCQNFQWTVAWSFSSQISLSSLRPRLHCVTLRVQQNCPAIYQEKWFRFRTVGSSGAGSTCVCSGIVTITFWTHFKLGIIPPLHYKDLSFWRYLSVNQMMLKTGHVIQCGLEHIQWKVAWSLNFKNLDVVNQSEQQILATTYRELYFPWHPGDGLVQHIFLVEFSCLNCTRLIEEAATQYDFECFAWEFTWSLHSACCAGMANTVPIQFFVSIAMRSSRSIELCQRKLSSDPGICALPYFFGFFTQVEVTGRRNAAAPTYYHGHYLDHASCFDNACVNQRYYLDTFCDQLNISDDHFLDQVSIACYLNLAKFRVNYGTQRDLSEVMKHQVPWDPGGSTWNRLEVKPKFKDGGMSATFAIITVGWTMGRRYRAWASQKPRRAASTYIRGEGLQRARLGSGRLRPPLLLSSSSSRIPLLLSSSSSRIPLLLCKARPS